MINLIYLPLMLFVLFQSGERKTSEQLVEAMRARGTSWYKTVTFVRLLQPGGKDGSQTLEAQFNKYARLAGG